MAINQYEYNYISGAFSCSSTGTKYEPWGVTYASNASWAVELESVRMSGAGYLVSNVDSATDNWRVGVDSSKHPYVYWSRSSSTYRGTYTFSNLTVSWDTWFYIKFAIVTNGASPTIRCTLNSSTQDVTASGRWHNSDATKSMSVGSSVTTIRGTAKVSGYAYNTNTLSTATFALDSITQGATSVTVDGYTYSCPAVQHYSDPAPTVSASFTYTSATQINLTVSANATCNKWEYKIGSGSWTTFSTTSATSQSYTLTVSSTSTVYARATKVSNGYTGEASVSVDRSSLTVTASVTQTAETTVTLTGTANVNCNKWEYRIGSGNWVSYSTTNGTSASTSVTLTKGSSYTLYVRATRTSNLVQGTSAGVTADKTASTVSVSISNVGANSFTISATSGDNCNKWEYSLGSGYTTFSTANGKSASTSVSGLTANTAYTVTVRVTKTSNYVTNTASASATTLGFSTITSVSNVNVGNKTTVTFTPLSTTFYYKVQLKWGSTVYATENIGKPAQTTAYSYQTTYAFPASVLANTTSATWTATLYTYTDSGYSNLVGTSDKTFTVSVPNSSPYLPTISSVTLTPNNTNAWINSKGYWVGGYTKANVSISASAGSGASITAYTVAGDITGSSASFTSGVLSAGTKSITVTVQDSRGRTATTTKTQVVQQYLAPSVQFSCERGVYSGGAWTSADGGDHIRVVATGTVSLSDNACTLYCTCTGNGQTYNGTTTSGTSATWYFTSTDAEHIYTISVWASDSVGTTGATSTQTVSTAEVAFSWNYDRIGVGQVAQSSKSLEIASTWKFTANGKNNTMAYMPYTWETSGIPSTAGYARIASIKVFQNWLYGTTTFTVTRAVNDSRPVKLYLRFQTGSELSAQNLWFYYDSIEGTGGTTFDAFAYQASSDTLDVYVQKSHQNDWLTVTVEPDSYVQSRCNFTYTNDLMSSVPASAWKAQPLGYSSPLTSTKAPILRFQIPANSTKRITGTSGGEICWLLSCTGWNSNLRDGLYYISGYSDSSRSRISTISSASGITITAVSGLLAYDITNTQSVTALLGLISLYGAMPTVT